MYYIVKYTGPFGFIKPYTAVRDGETFSQNFLTPSIIKGIELKLFPELLEKENLEIIEKIKRHRLTYDSMTPQQETTLAKDFEVKKNIAKRVKSIIVRGLLINPTLYLAFNTKLDADRALVQHICLCRNEDILIPEGDIIELNEEEIENIGGFELIFGKDEDSFMVGYNRFDNANPMYGRLNIVGYPTKSDFEG